MLYLALFASLVVLFVIRVMLLSTDNDALFGKDAWPLWGLLLLGAASFAALVHWRAKRTWKSKFIAFVLLAASFLSIGIYLWKGLSA